MSGWISECDCLNIRSGDCIGRMPRHKNIHENFGSMDHFLNANCLKIVIINLFCILLFLLDNGAQRFVSNLSVWNSFDLNNLKKTKIPLNFSFQILQKLDLSIGHCPKINCQDWIENFDLTKLHKYDTQPRNQPVLSHVQPSKTSFDVTNRKHSNTSQLA